MLTFQPRLSRFQRSNRDGVGALTRWTQSSRRTMHGRPRGWSCWTLTVVASYLECYLTLLSDATLHRRSWPSCILCDRWGQLFTVFDHGICYSYSREVDPVMHLASTGAIERKRGDWWCISLLPTWSMTPRACFTGWIW
jgi:hypothetical protein